MKTKKETKSLAAAVEFLNGLRAVAFEKELRASEAIRQLIDAQPNITRPDCYKAAVQVGINHFTARNIWDAINHG